MSKKEDDDGSVKLPKGKVGKAYNASVDVPAPDAVSSVIQSGSLPPGLTIELENIVGTPTGPGNATFTLWHINAQGIHVGPPVTYTISVAE